MKVRWIAEARAIGATQLEVEPGDVINVDDDLARSFIEQHLAVDPADKKENR